MASQSLWKRGQDIGAVCSRVLPSFDQIGGVFTPKELVELLRELAGTGKPTSATLAHARMDIMSRAQRPMLQDVELWYQRQTKTRDENIKRNRLLVKDTIGSTRDSAYILPEDDHTYGHANVPDKEGAGAVALNWRPAVASKSKLYGQNIVQKNRRAVQEGVTSAKGMMEWHKSHSIQVKVVKGKKQVPGCRLRVPAGTTFGRPSKESEHVPELLSAEVLARPDRSYPDMKGQKKPGRLPRPRPTKSSTTQYDANRAYLDKQAVIASRPQAWKMPKFSKIPAAIDRFGMAAGTAGLAGLTGAIEDVADMADVDGAEAVDEGKTAAPEVDEGKVAGLEGEC